MFSGTSVSPWRQSYEGWIPLPLEVTILSWVTSSPSEYLPFTFLFHGTFLPFLHCFDVYLIIFRVYPESGLQFRLTSLVPSLLSYQRFGWSLSIAIATSVEMYQISMAGSRRILVRTGMKSSQNLTEQRSKFYAHIELSRAWTELGKMVVIQDLATLQETGVRLVSTFSCSPPASLSITNASRFSLLNDFQFHLFLFIPTVAGIVHVSTDLTCPSCLPDPSSVMPEWCFRDADLIA